MMYHQSTYINPRIGVSVQVFGLHCDPIEVDKLGVQEHELERKRKRNEYK